MKYSDDECRELVKWARTYCGAAQKDIFDLAAALSERLGPVGDENIYKILVLLERGYQWERDFAAATRALLRERDELRVRVKELEVQAKLWTDEEAADIIRQFLRERALAQNHKEEVAKDFLAMERERDELRATVKSHLFENKQLHTVNNALIERVKALEDIRDNSKQQWARERAKKGLGETDGTEDQSVDC